MPDLKNLPHCVEVVLKDGPSDVTVSSFEGPGHVEVRQPDPGVIYGVVIVPGSGTVHADPGPVRLHYYRHLGGPVAIDAEVTQA